MSQTILAPVSVETTMNYYVTPEKGDTKDIYPGTAANYRQKYDVQPATVTDMRSVADQDFTLDVQGFQLAKHTCSEKEWVDENRVKDIGYKEIKEFLKNLTGATSVHIIGHLARRQSWETAKASTAGLDDKDFVPLPSYATNRYCHVDQSYNGAEAVLKEELPDDAKRLSKSRWAIINAWRPINQVVRREPLAVCDARTVDEEDLHEVTLHIAQTNILKSVSTGIKRFLTWTVSANEKHKWYYASELTPEEVLLIKIYDSEVNGRARRTPHSAFVTPGDCGPPRESVEVRCLVFWEGEK